MRSGERLLTPQRVAVDGHESRPLADRWEAASCPPDSRLDPAALDDLDWLPATVPGTAAGALRDSGRWSLGDPHDFDAEDWWFRSRFEAEPAADGEELLLRFDGIATDAQVFLDGRLVLETDSMFVAAAVDVGDLVAPGGSELAIRCRALGPMLEATRKPRARWRQRLVAGGLRFHRTMLIGRMPGIAEGPAAVGPWRPVRLERRRGLAVESLDTRATLIGPDEADGELVARVELRTLSGPPSGAIEVELSGPSGVHRASMKVEAAEDRVVATAAMTIPEVARWLPHTHGEPALHDVRLIVSTGAGPVVVDAGRVGFSAVGRGSKDEPWDLDRDGIDLRIQGGPRLFARGAVWTPLDPIGLAPGDDELRAALEQVRAAGMNMLRVVGTAAYESRAFHDLCDELGILVWQDFMFANMDYPIEDEAFRAAVEREVGQALAAVAARPSLAVLCGNSEIEQQVAMLGLDPAIGRGELFGGLLDRLSREACPQLPYVPSAPCGGDLPFRNDRGVANYFGVGGYRRPLEDARLAGVRFASECLAIANFPEDDVARGVGVPRDSGVDWDFQDVRDHYLEQLFGVGADELWASDEQRYMELSRAVSGELMAAVFGEWRRGGSPCGGGLVLWLRDLVPGAGWGVVDQAGGPKAAYHHLRRALAPTSVWMTDEGLNGVGVHLANDKGEPLPAVLRVRLYRDFEQRLEEAETALELAPHSVETHDVEALLGRFADASWAYRFGPPAQSLVVAALERDGAGGEQLSQAFFFPAGRPSAVEAPEELGLKVGAERLDDGAWVVSVSARRFAYGVRLHAPGRRPDDNCFSIEPGGTRTIVLRPSGREENPELVVSALNMRGSVTIPID